MRERLSERLRATWRGPRSLTAIVPIPGASTDVLRARLEALAAPIEAAVAAVPTLHSLRMAAVPAREGEQPGASVLVNLVHDEPPATDVGELVRVAGPLLARALDGAARFDGDPRGLAALLDRHREREHTVHLGAIGRTVREVHAEHRLREAIQTFADAQLRTGAWDERTSAETMRVEMRAHVLSRGDGLPTGPAPSAPASARALRAADLIASFAFPAIGVLAPDVHEAIGRIERAPARIAARVAWGLWWLYGGIPTALSLAWVRLLERLEADRVAPPPDEETLRRLEDSEDRRPKNVVTLWLPVRPTLARRMLLGSILWGAERGCRHVWTDGRLAGIETIHYARIMQVDRGRTMLFMSEYDGGLARYLDDFVGVGHRAVLPISSNLDGCPKTRWLFWQDDPSTFDARWRGLIRRYQLETPVWYSAYPRLTVREILANARIRQGLFATSLSEHDAREWVRRL
jgi:hypothetical protein